MAKELLFSVTKNDLIIDYFSGSGAGGQHRNKHQNCVRLYHKDSDVRVTGQSNKERKSNLREAFKNLIKHPKFKMWHSVRIQEILRGKSFKKEVEKMMNAENLRIECFDGKRWIKDERTIQN